MAAVLVFSVLDTNHDASISQVPSFFFTTLEPRVERYRSLRALNTGPPRNPGPMSSDLPHNKTVKATFWSWLSDEIPENLFRCSFFSQCGSWRAHFYRATSLIRNRPPLGPLKGPSHVPTIGS